MLFSLEAGIYFIAEQYRLLTEQWLQLFLNFALTWILSLSIFSDLAAFCLTVEIRLINVTKTGKIEIGSLNKMFLMKMCVMRCGFLWVCIAVYPLWIYLGGKRDAGIWFPTSCLLVWCIIYLNGKIVNLRHVAYFFLSLTCFLLSLYQLPFAELCF